MATLFTLPIVPDSYNYKYEVTLDGVIFIIELQYNSRKDGWFLSLYDYDDNPLINGIKVKMGSDLLQQFRHIEGIPSGRLAVVNWNDQEEANLENFGDKVLLSYIGDA